MSKILILYVFHEYNNRVINFIKHATFEHPDIDFLFISNQSIIISDLPYYIKILYRDNIGFDFGGWSYGLLTDNIYLNYDYFIFVNSSVIGPFIPDYCNIKWPFIYINNLNDNIKLFGSTINICQDINNYAHVQSYIFSMDIHTCKFLINNGIFSITHFLSDFNETILYKEVLMSRLIINNGWNIGSLMKIYKNIDFRLKYDENNEINKHHDFMCFEFKNKYWHEYELVFIKGNRDIRISNILI